MLLNKSQQTMLPDSSAETTKLGSNFDQSMEQTFVPSCKTIMHHYYLVQFSLLYEISMPQRTIYYAGTSFYDYLPPKNAYPLKRAI
jgi:hypothetical protein